MGYSKHLQWCSSSPEKTSRACGQRRWTFEYGFDYALRMIVIPDLLVINRICLSIPLRSVILLAWGQVSTVPLYVPPDVFLVIDWLTNPLEVR